MGKMEKKMETTIMVYILSLYKGAFIGEMEKTMETTIMGLGFRACFFFGGGVRI